MGQHFGAEVRQNQAPAGQLPAMCNERAVIEKRRIGSGERPDSADEEIGGGGDVEQGGVQTGITGVRNGGAVKRQTERRRVGGRIVRDSRAGHREARDRSWLALLERHELDQRSLTRICPGTRPARNLQRLTHAIGAPLPVPRQ